MKPFFAMGDEFIDSVDAELSESADLIADIAEMTAPKKTYRLSEGHRVERVKKFVYRVWNDVYYAEYVHEGTRWMAPRPWLKNAHDEVVSGMLARINMRFKYGGGRKLTVAEAEKELFG